MPCIPLGGGSFACGSDFAMLSAEARKELESFKRWLVLHRSGETQKTFDEWRQDSEGET